MEDSIIAVLDPEWNGGKKVRGDDTEEPEDRDDLPKARPDLSSIGAAIPQITVKMGATYWDKGFFNIGVDGSVLLGTDGQTVEIYCDDHAEPVFGSINRRAKLNGTLRIFGGKRLRE